MSAYPNLHLIAYGTGGQRLNRSELAVEAADALERLNRTCATCKRSARPFTTLGPDERFCVRYCELVNASHYCGYWQPLTPAHDKEKSST